MILLYALSVSWAIGLLGVAVYAQKDTTSTTTGAVIFWALVAPLWFVIGLLPFFLVWNENQPTLATLSKSDWQCASSHKVTSTRLVQSGKVMVPITTTTDVCDLYGRKQ